MTQFKQITCTINGRTVTRVVDIRASLTDLLREDFRLTSVKKGCEVGECGACNVIIDGECFNSCLYLAVLADGKEILTIEGFEKNGQIARLDYYIWETACKYLKNWKEQGKEEYYISVNM